MGQLFVVSAPSGAGKTTLCRHLMESAPDLAYSVSYTTRPPRPGEKDGRDYHFVTPDRFKEMIGQGAFFEWAEVFGRYYGTGRDWVQARLGEGLDVLVDIDVEGARQIRSNFPGAVLIFVLPPTFRILEERLRRRHTETEVELAHRLSHARLEIEARDMYDYLVVNDRVDRAVDDLAAVIRAERLRLARARGFWPSFFGDPT
ncbi:MAG: guanylate kinase [Thermodesulfobacteriota bacterium]